MQCTIRQRRHLECNSLRHAEPMKADERGGDMITASQVESCIYRDTFRQINWALHYDYYSAPIGERSIVMTVLSVCLPASIYICNYKSDLHQNKLFAHLPVTETILLWRRCDTLCTSGIWITSYLPINGHMQRCRNSHQARWCRRLLGAADGQQQREPLHCQLSSFASRSVNKLVLSYGAQACIIQRMLCVCTTAARSVRWRATFRRRRQCNVTSARSPEAACLTDAHRQKHRQPPLQSHTC